MSIYKAKNGKWKIKNVKGESDTRQEAVKRLQAIEMSKARRGKK